MDDNCGLHVCFGKEDIIKDCKYCHKTDRKGFGSRHAYGYECQLKPEKCRCKRCRQCYFGPHRNCGY